jgi:hypothetical protein
MARKRRPNERPSYQPAPTVPPPVQSRFTVLTQVLASQMTVSEGARQLSLARVNFQTLVHRGKAALIEVLMPRQSGPSPRSSQEVKLSREVEALRRDKAKLQEQLETMDRLLGAAGDVIRGLRRPERRRSSTSSSRRSKRSSTAEDE